MAESDHGVGLGEFFECKSRLSCRCVDLDFQGVVFAHFQVVDVKAAFFAPGKDGDDAGIGGGGQEGQEVVDYAEAGIVGERGESVDPFGGF